MASDRSIRDLIQQARRSVQEADEVVKAAKSDLADLEESFRLRLTETRQRIAVAEAVAAERRKIATVLESLNASEANKAHAGRRRSRGGRQGIGREWRAILSKLPIRPAPSMVVRDIYRMQGVEDDEGAQKRIRSQLHLYKKKGILELVDGGWRLLNPLEDETTEVNENGSTAQAEAPEAEAPEQAEPAGASEFDEPLSSFHHRAAA